MRKHHKSGTLCSQALHRSPSTSSCVATGRQHHRTVTLFCKQINNDAYEKKNKGAVRLCGPSVLSLAVTMHQKNFILASSM